MSKSTQNVQCNRAYSNAFSIKSNARFCQLVSHYLIICSSIKTPKFMTGNALVGLGSRFSIQVYALVFNFAC